ncbi:MAG: hypothetical protein ABI910_08585 [Gemmatimonadota bacterium]
MTRPRTITFVGWLFIVVGIAGLLNDLWPLATSHATEQLAKLSADGWTDLGPAWSLRLLAIVGGAALLRRRNWARRLLEAWMLAHAGVSFFHPASEFLVHLAIFTPLIYLLFRRESDIYFDDAKAARA